MCIVPDSYDGLEAKGVVSHILQRDLGGYWDKVVTVHPFCHRRRVIKMSSVHTVQEYRLWDALLLPKILRLAKREGVTAIKAHDPYFTGPLALVLSLLLRVPYVVMICSSYDLIEERGETQLRLKMLDKLVSRIVLSRAATVFGGSGIARDWATRNRASSTELVRTGGIADAHFVPPSKREIARPSNGGTVLLVGRLDSIKYPEDALSAFALIKRKYPSALLLVVGDGALRTDLERKYNDPSIRFLRFVKHPSLMAQIMAESDVALVPLGGSALVELALAEVPIVAYDTDWHKELVHDGAGVLVPFRDYKAMADAAVALLMGKDNAKEIGAKARETALAQHSLDVVQKHEARCFDKILARSSR